MEIGTRCTGEVQRLDAVTEWAWIVWKILLWLEKMSRLYVGIQQWKNRRYSHQGTRKYQTDGTGNQIYVGLVLDLNN